LALWRRRFDEIEGGDEVDVADDVFLFVLELLLEESLMIFSHSLQLFKLLIC
jgi:hypothetical protein